MKKLAIYLLLGFAIMFLLSFMAAVSDDAYKKIYYTGIWYKDIFGAFKYYILWVVPYWWLIIIVGTIILALIIYILRISILKLKG